MWRAPPFIRINHGSRWVRLDFERATIDSSVIDIEVIGGAGWLLLVLPAGWAADLDRLATGWGSTSVKVPREPAAGKPLLVIHGSVGAGRVRLRNPSRRDRRISERTKTDSSSAHPVGTQGNLVVADEAALGRKVGDEVAEPDRRRLAERHGRRRRWVRMRASRTVRLKGLTT